MPKLVHLTEEQELAIISDYIEGYSQLATGKRNGVSSYKVCEVLKRNSIGIRTNSESKTKYHCNEKFFEVIDTEEKAYWLGFIAADGFLLTDRDHWGVTLSLIDKPHLEKLKNSLNSTHPINEFAVDKGKGYYSCRIYVVSKKMKDDLVDKGIQEMKTSVLKFPSYEKVPKNLINHYLRGYFDGDGSLFRDSRKRWYISLLGTEDFLQGFLREVGIKCNTVQDARSTVKYISIGARDNVQKVMAYLYKESTIFLERKYEKFIEFTGPARK